MPADRILITGISGFIDPFGRVQHATAIFTQEAVTGTIEIGPPKTFYARYGDLFAYGCVIITAILCLTGYFSQSTEPAGVTPAGRPA